MLDSDQSKKKIRLLAERLGVHTMTKTLVGEGFSFSLATLVVRGKYPHELNPKSIELLDSVFKKCS